MIVQEEKGFRLETVQTSYWFRVTPHGHLEHVWYGPKLAGERTSRIWDALALKRTIAPGSSVLYDEADPTYCLNVVPQEWSTQGRGDYRETPCEAIMPDGTMVHDFQYRGRKIVEGACEPETLPGAYGSQEDCQTLIVYLQDTLQKVFLTLYYTVYEETDVITRRVVLRNEEESPLCLQKLLSFMLDVPDASLPAWEICSEMSPAGISFSATVTR